MALILNLETATKTCSVALAKDGELLSCKELASDNYSHAEKLNGFIVEVLAESSIDIKDLDAVAVSAGPGSYTGLRIGTSTAKGLCYGLDIPLISINSLKALANQADVRDGLICPMFDARRMEVYTALYATNLTEIQATNALVVESENLKGFLGKQITFIGPGAEKCQEMFGSDEHSFKLDIEVSAKGMISLSEDKFKEGNFEDVAYFEPAYLKDFVAGPPKKLL
ncbi:MAG: tRNA threonylcarbamoyladenosine biosynthesis protein TsaB [Arenicella sp.]|jgi:tRNA threonylcarbamoyladenosine biosynthesis protein TsaB